MKATKLIINGEVQNLASENSTPGVTYIVYNHGNNSYTVNEGNFNNGDLILIDVESADEPTDSINIDGNVIEIHGYDDNNGWNWSS